MPTCRKLSHCIPGHIPLADTSLINLSNRFRTLTCDLDLSPLVVLQVKAPGVSQVLASLVATVHQQVPVVQDFTGMAASGTRAQPL